ncbi:DUF3592 domain-containing protein [Gimesia aquarii]|uniref:DUF3592 domain-containing protein n=1 Tax=Gimesia aquarii TaxID=2527964 RepID=A0A517W4K2_9PLAN|nr:DUF3592 domain-containing protein [Gimesia aquarii]QDU00179.1 hypothetical protein V144x_56920 [Gimesia aquarii]
MRGRIFNHSRKKGRFIFLSLGIIFMGTGYFIAYHIGLPLIKEAKASTSWPTTTGVIQNSKVKVHRSNDSNSSTYSAEVIYRYQVEQNEFQSETVWFGGDISTSNRSMAQETVKKYPAKKQVTVYYNPNKPATAVLEPGVFTMTYFYYIFGWLFLGVGILSTGIPLFRTLFRIIVGNR